MIQMNILERMRGFAFHPAKEFAAAKGDTLSDAFKYYFILLVGLAVIIAVVLTIAAIAVAPLLGLPDVVKFSPLAGAGAFVGIIAVGILAALYIPVWLHIWVYLFGGRKGLTPTVKAVTYGATPCLMLGWLPGANILIGPIWSVLVIISGVMELHKLSPGMAILAVILAILVPLIIVGAGAAAIAAIVPTMMPGL